MEFIDNEASDDDDDSGEEEVIQWTQADRDFIDDDSSSSSPSSSMLTKRKFHEEQQGEFENEAKRMLAQLQDRKKMREMEEEASRVSPTSITSYFAPKDTGGSSSSSSARPEGNAPRGDEGNVLALRRVRRVVVRWQRS